ncbi:MAG: transposase [Desulforegulaceae bacterium]|nr:transposase [Desulforegulaceae bacterium]
MIRIKNHNQKELFAPWDFLSPKRKKMLSESWAGLFQEEILHKLPVKELSAYFNSGFGRPTKELHTVLGILIIQQMFDLTDEETVNQLAFNMQWHYALNLTEESDDAKYICPKTLWNMRKIVIENALDELLFSNITQHLVSIFNVDTNKQRIDSVHIKSNMRKLGRITIFTSAINKFLVNMKRSHKNLFDTIDQKIIDTYLSEKSFSFGSLKLTH